MRIYISGAVTGTDNWKERFEYAENYLRKTYPDADIVNPAKVTAALPESTTWQQYMDVTLNCLRGCDTIYILEGWEKSRGATIESIYAHGSEMKILYEER